MKFLQMSFVILFGMCGVLPALAVQDKWESAKVMLKNVDAVQAMAIANQWKWSEKEIKSYVNPGEVVFKFSDGEVKKVPIPSDKMVIAVAPYIRKTHE